MEVLIMDENFKQICLIDAFESLIWTERYSSCGNFEIYTPADAALMDTVKQDYYVWLKESDQVMIVEEVQVSTEVETGGHLIISGRSLESILDRRIIWRKTVLSGNLQNGIRKLLNENVISPEIEDRKISGFLFQDSTDPLVTGLTIKAQYTGDNLYETIETICQTYNLGFQVTLNEQNQFVFMLYSGADRSYDQTENPYVIFSPKFENIINSDYLESGKTLKNITLVAGEGEGLARTSLVVGGGAGLKRRELYTDARDIQSEDYSQQLDADTEILDDYKQKLFDDQQALSDETTAAMEETAEYNTKKADHDQRKADYGIRIINFSQRISYYNQKIADYEASLTSEQKATLALRNGYKQQVEGYEEIISDCSDQINSYNSKLRNERGLTYEKIVQYEQAIEDLEATKSSYEEKKNACEQNKTEEEKKLPDYKNTLDDYEKKISKYEEIILNDQKSLSDETAAANEDATEHNKKMADYGKRKTDYENRISGYNQKIAEYEGKITEDKRLLDDLYNALLEQRGKEKLSENTYTKAFTSKIEATKTFVYGKDFHKGDIVQIVNEYGIESKVRVIEIVRVQDTTGFEMYPTFSVVE